MVPSPPPLERGSFAQPLQSVPADTFPRDSQLQTPDKHRSLPSATTYSTHRHVFLQAAGAPLGASAPQQGATQETTTVQTQYENLRGRRYLF